jgi:hypothetical protein
MKERSVARLLPVIWLMSPLLLITACGDLLDPTQSDEYKSLEQRWLTESGRAGDLRHLTGELQLRIDTQEAAIAQLEHDAIRADALEREVDDLRHEISQAQRNLDTAREQLLAISQGAVSPIILVSAETKVIALSGNNAITWSYSVTLMNTTNEQQDFSAWIVLVDDDGLLWHRGPWLLNKTLGPREAGVFRGTEGSIRRSVREAFDSLHVEIEW